MYVCNVFFCIIVCVLYKLMRLKSRSTTIIACDIIFKSHLLPSKGYLRRDFNTHITVYKYPLLHHAILMIIIPILLITITIQPLAEDKNTIFFFLI